ncbi:MAG: mechanosensitive ion channel, partial [Alphaproteobacteria bacterium]|nr:mechanosensitive ion channel [Alphaproteobacteria bacterium]
SQLVETTLVTANADQWAAKAGFGELSGDAPSNMGLSKILSTLLYAIIMILFAIAGLQALGISSISEPAVAMLSTVFNAIPRFILAGVLLGIGFIIGKFVKRLIEQVMPSLGVDNSVASLNILPAGTSASALLGNLSMTAIMLLIGIQALQSLQFGPLTDILTQVVNLGGRVLFGAVIIGAGVMLAQMVAKLMAGATGTDGIANKIVRYAIVALSIAMGLHFMGLADKIVDMAFGLILGSAAVAAAIAFGLGGREAAAKALDKLDK